MTLGFKEKEKGWTSFFSYEPDEFLRLGSSFFSIKEGNLWEHNDKGNPITNIFYGKRYPSSIDTVFNDAQTEDKIFKTFVIEGSSTWNVNLKTNLSQTSLFQTDFNKKESRFFAYLRQNELEDDFHGNAQGIGVCLNIAANTLEFDYVSDFTNVGDKLYRLDNDKEEFVGIIKSKTSTTVSIDNSINQGKGFFFFSSKDSRIEGGEVRGYYASVSLTNHDQGQLELFAINSNIVKSYV